MYQTPYRRNEHSEVSRKDRVRRTRHQQRRPMHVSFHHSSSLLFVLLLLLICSGLLIQMELHQQNRLVLFFDHIGDPFDLAPYPQHILDFRNPTF